MDVIANNLANINTAGYKNDALLFEEYVMPTASMNGFRSLDQKVSYVHDDTIAHSFRPGSIVETSNPVNAAINDDESFFVVQAPGGERYTRNGEFDINANGELVTTEGYPVLGTDGPIVFTQEDEDIHINREGTITTTRGEINRLQVVTFENLQGLRKEGFSLFIGENPIPVDDPDILGGRVEGSNVQGVLEISRMIEVTRSYASLAKALDATKDLRASAIDALGKLTA